MITNIVLDSSYRNSIFSSNNKWVYSPSKSYLNVKDFKLTGCIIPNTQYLIHDNNNSLTITYLATDYIFTLTKGFYTPSTLATELQTQLNTNGFGATFTISQSSTTHKFRFQCTGSIIYKFASNSSLAKILGFTVSNTTSSTDITGANIYDLSGSKYYNLRINEINNALDTNITQINQSFVIPNNVNFGEYNYLTDNTNIINDIRNMQNRIDKLTIELFDDENNLVNLNGANYILFFSIEQ